MHFNYPLLDYLYKICSLLRVVGCFFGGKLTLKMGQGNKKASYKRIDLLILLFNNFQILKWLIFEIQKLKLQLNVDL